jgi:hypothetical protein
MKKEDLINLLNQISDPGLREKLLTMHRALQKDICFYPAAIYHHHAWEGGYGDHVAQVMAMGLKLYDLMPPEAQAQFSRDDVLLVAYVHDLDKLLRYQKTESDWKLKQGKVWEIRNGLPGYDEAPKVIAMCAQHGILLEDKHLEAICHHHGGFSLSTMAGQQTEMTVFSTLIHSADMFSAHVWGARPKS